MNRWVVRCLLITLVAGVVAAVLPGIRQSLADGNSDTQWLQRPDRGSLLVALAVAVALARVFTTLDRRRRSAGS